MATQNTINLLKTNATLSPTVLGMEEKVKVASFVAIGALIVIGVLTTGAYLILLNQKQSITSSKDQLKRAIGLQAEKEVKFTAVRNRLAMIDRIQTNKTKWGAIVSVIETIGVPPALQSIVTSDKQLSLVFQTTTLSDITPMVTTLVTLAQNRKIRNVQLASLQIGQDGIIKVSFSFVPLL